MSVLVVHSLEVVKVQKEQSKFIAEPGRTVDLLANHRKEMASVIQTGAIVGDTEFLYAAHGPGIFDSNGGVVSQGLQEELASDIHLHIDVHQLNHAEDLAGGTNWHAHDWA